MDFKNLGFFAAVFQSLANSASNVVSVIAIRNIRFASSKNFQIFDNLKPLLLKDAYVKIKAAIDDNLLKLVGTTLNPNSITPIDNAIAAARKKVRENG